MFQGWDFLLAEIWVLIVLAALIGLFVGWLVWGGRVEAVPDKAEADSLRADLQACQTRARDCAARVARLEDDLARALALATDRASASGTPSPATVAGSSLDDPSLDEPPAPAQPAPSSAAPPAATETEPSETEPAETEPAETEPAGTKPQALAAPRNGQADDLKRIKGIGPKLEALCNRLGFWHFDQIAAWTPEEIAWVDANLESFKGRVTRDNWVAQARVLAAEKRP